MASRRLLYLLILALALPAAAWADTIRLKNGSVLRGKVIRFDGKEFTVVLDGTQSRAMILVGDVASIDFDEAPASPAGTERPVIREEIPVPETNPPPSPRPQPSTTTPGNAVPSSNSPAVHESTVEVSAREVWVDSGVEIKQGQRVRIAATGRVTLTAGRSTGPEGVDVKDPDKLMPGELTGALIGVIGDDNDDFFVIGAAQEFVANRDGRLFLMLNEGSLEDNSGSFSVRIQVEGLDSSGKKP